jgi:hypothetical protein
MPGIIDAHSHIALSSVNEATSPVTAEVWMGDVVNHLDIAVYRALAGGVTISHAMHGSANVIGGQNVTLKHRWGETDPDLWIMEGAPRTVKFALGENPTRVHGRGRGIRPATRMGVEQVLREAFTDARRYRQAQRAAPARTRRAEAPRYNLRMETIASILDGDILIHAHSYRSDEILMLMDVLRDFGDRPPHVPARERGVQGGPGAGRLRRLVLGVLGLVRLQVRGLLLDGLQRGHPDAERRPHEHQLRLGRAHPPPLPRGGEGAALRGLSDDEALALITINPATSSASPAAWDRSRWEGRRPRAFPGAPPLGLHRPRDDRRGRGRPLRPPARPRRHAPREGPRRQPGGPRRCMQGVHDHESCMEGVRQAGLWWMA